MELTLNLVRYYVYVYTDLEKPGRYEVQTSMGSFTFDHQPVYIGKGAGDRMISHQRGASNSRLMDLIDRGNFECKTISFGLPSYSAHALEAELIYRIGRIDLGKGPLFNESAGVQLYEAKGTDDIGPYHLEFNRLLHILKILNQCKTNKDASKVLGISERSLYRYIKDYRLKKLEGSWVQI